MKPVILCVDDEMIILSTITQQIREILGRSYDIEIAQGGEEAIDLVLDLLEEGIRIPVIISDFMMPGMNGDQLLLKLKKISPKSNCILLTGMDKRDLGIPPEDIDKIFEFIPKPWEYEVFAKTIRDAVE